MKKQKVKLKKSSWKFVSVATIVCILTAIIVYFMVAKEIKDAREKVTHNKAVALGLFGASSEIAERHVWITEHSKGAGRYGDVPVHIMFRKSNNDVWQFRGTGTRLGKRPNFLLTAYHVFEGSTGQFGCRKIGPKELTGEEKNIPIESCEYFGNADDAVVCLINENRPDFPILSVPVSENMFHNWADKNYQCKIWPAKIHLTTYPERTVQNIFFIQVDSSAFHFIFDWKVMPGESGTSAVVEGEKENAYLVVIRDQAIPPNVINQLTESEKKLLNLSKGKIYGVGNLILLDPKN